MDQAQLNTAVSELSQSLTPQTEAFQGPFLPISRRTSKQQFWKLFLKNLFHLYTYLDMQCFKISHWTPSDTSAALIPAVKFKFAYLQSFSKHT